MSILGSRLMLNIRVTAERTRRASGCAGSDFGISEATGTDSRGQAEQRVSTMRFAYSHEEHEHEAAAGDGNLDGGASTDCGNRT